MVTFHWPSTHGFCEQQREVDEATFQLQIENYFKRCRDLADALWEASTGVAQVEVLKFVWEDDGLAICDGLAHASKHHTRRPAKKGNRPAAWIEAVRGSGELHVTWDSAAGDSGTIDALVLADRCYDAWKGF